MNCVATGELAVQLRRRVQRWEDKLPSPTGPRPGPNAGRMQLAEPPAANEPTPAPAEPTPAATTPTPAAIELTSPAVRTAPSPILPPPELSHPFPKLQVKAPSESAVPAQAPPATGPPPPAVNADNVALSISSLQPPPPSHGRQVLLAGETFESANAGPYANAEAAQADAGQLANADGPTTDAGQQTNADPPVGSEEPPAAGPTEMLAPANAQPPTAIRQLPEPKAMRAMAADPTPPQPTAEVSVQGRLFRPDGRGAGTAKCANRGKRRQPEHGRRPPVRWPIGATHPAPLANAGQPIGQHARMARPSAPPPPANCGAQPGQHQPELASGAVSVSGH